MIFGPNFNSVWIGVLAFVAIFGGVLLGVLMSKRLPEQHLGSDTRTAVSVSMAVVGTLSALVISLLISTANSSFMARTNAIGDLAVDILRLDRSLVRYGPGADAIRSTIHEYATAKVGELSRNRREALGLETMRVLETVSDQITNLKPVDDRERIIQAQALRFVEAISDARWILLEKNSSAVPGPFLILLIFWLAILFASFGLFAPRNATALAALFLCSVAVAGGIFMILELASPSEGIIQPSLKPLQTAIAQLRAD
ncbi:hypothetical protein K32_03380 [Kaistia sp. 32K]|uniref:bestrophin-like domain n=1 Tax=Kaistia sp. 32K TaxID=2795690 RepID=UPI0019159E25|nr:hypothetical protein [Kaistia sp. 32K]BCP51721.1 hypothetical protein K32_03380 [Kaistia sp. 32K]